MPISAPTSRTPPTDARAPRPAGRHTQPRMASMVSCGKPTRPPAQPSAALIRASMPMNASSMAATLSASASPVEAPSAAASITFDHGRSTSSRTVPAVRLSSVSGSISFDMTRPAGAPITLAAIRCPAMSGKRGLEDADVDHHHAAGDGDEAAGHHRHQLGPRERLDVGTDEERRLGVADEDVGGRRQRLGARGAHQPHRHPGEHLDHLLHHAQVVEDGDEAREEDDRRQHLERR